jgi:RNA 2',3'-cyclic 3'-phosphodiesterase
VRIAFRANLPRAIVCTRPCFRLQACQSRQFASDVVAETRAEPFEVSFDCTMSFRGGRGNRPFVLTGSAGLNRLKSFRRSLAVVFKKRGLGFLARRDFTPHVTLLFDDRAIEEHPAGPICWTVGELVLIHSLNGHEHLARWPLYV